ncbi:sigma-70 family RNA polymerase sigma factor [Membranicola marinus]|uniref:Sigma-70 family RNA polymerase sigma factor n=1 Tax=Membranihabitans marinus TaxID=1227546 RepID=A0A953HRD1_9BACT|nr:sigma-70 family RNA polymerase sigma factor [Membranihabitans marinus]MBY5959513.1 sigma-70 family RNA polymerase sigma factor [Membranihabitans marinus]
MDNINVDQESWILLKQGDQKALSRIYHRYYASLHQYGYKLTGDTALVEDCLQEMFLYMYEKRQTLGDVTYIRAYLFRSFRRRLLKKLRNQRRSVYVSMDDSWMVMPNELEALDHDENQRKMLAALINGLSPRQRELIYLRYYNDLSPREIAEMLSISYRAVINTLYKAMVKLRAHRDKLEDIE